MIDEIYEEIKKRNITIDQYSFADWIQQYILTEFQ